MKCALSLPKAAGVPGRESVCVCEVELCSCSEKKTQAKCIVNEDTVLKPPRCAAVSCNGSRQDTKGMRRQQSRDTDCSGERRRRRSRSIIFPGAINKPWHVKPLLCGEDWWENSNEKRGRGGAPPHPRFSSSVFALIPLFKVFSANVTGSDEGGGYWVEFVQCVNPWGKAWCICDVEIDLQHHLGLSSTQAALNFMYPASVCLCIRWLSRDTQRSAHSQAYVCVLWLSVAASSKLLPVHGSRIISRDVTLSCFCLQPPVWLNYSFGTTCCSASAFQLFPSCRCSGLLSDLISIFEEITNFLSSLFVRTFLTLLYY